jgi:hypothetical protein
MSTITLPKLFGSAALKSTRVSTISSGLPAMLTILSEINLPGIVGFFVLSS